MTFIQKITNGQLDIPREIWETLQWSKNEVKVKIQPIKDGFKVNRISRIHSSKKKITKKEGERIWEDMKRISKLGKQNVDLTKFLRHDRDTHF